MNSALYIAKRYLFSKKKKAFIHILSRLTILVLTTSAAAMVIILSGFNGMEGVMRGLFYSFDSELKMVPKQGKTFVLDSTFIKKVESIDGIETYSSIIEENALMLYKDQQMVVRIKGVDKHYKKMTGVDSLIATGTFDLYRGKQAVAVVGQGVQYRLGFSLSDYFNPLQLWYPQRKGKIKGNLDPTASFTKMQIAPEGVFAIEKQFDEKYVFLPIDFAASLTNYGNERSFLEVQSNATITTDQLKTKLLSTFGKDFHIFNRDEQHPSLMKALRIERLFLYFAIAIVFAIASLNIYFLTTMIAIEKKKDIGILKSMGASKRLIQGIFTNVGFLVGLLSGGLGMLIGITFVILQMNFGWIKYNAETAITDAIPMELSLFDLLLVATLILVISLSFSFFPARKAAGIKEIPK